ncbi:hypothetical protein DSO57_1029600 [Entomophthora muscae]|uniref:Uncharacterized protein n=1 Tax=Entomophthora muscae TaxID=34485 RepID=A0ACC2TNA8_9FUNG|nr:hypothetical protein DSO57_1029600 [Entomophthora muscae]
MGMVTALSDLGHVTNNIAGSKSLKKKGTQEMGGLASSLDTRSPPLMPHVRGQDPVGMHQQQIGDKFNLKLGIQHPNLKYLSLGRAYQEQLLPGPDNPPLNPRCSQQWQGQLIPATDQGSSKYFVLGCLLWLASGQSMGQPCNAPQMASKGSTYSPVSTLLFKMC